MVVQSILVVLPVVLVATVILLLPSSSSSSITPKMTMVQCFSIITINRHKTQHQHQHQYQHQYQLNKRQDQQRKGQNNNQRYLLFATNDGFESSNNNNNDDDDDSNIKGKNDNSNNNNKNIIMECEIRDGNDKLKQELLSLAASYDRGYGSSPRIRQHVMTIIQQLELYNPSINPALSILPKPVTTTSTGNTNGMVSNYSLRYNWRMIWTTAIDVLGLNASPIFTVGAIYQCFTQSSSTSLSYTDSSDDNDDTIITNVIDLLPRIQSLVPPNLLPNTLIRLSVQTRASEYIQSQSTSSTNNNNNRIGLTFESVQIEPIEILGQKISIFPPLKIDLPKLPSFLLDTTTTTTKSSSSKNTPQGYFDVTYLDDTMLIIRQNTDLLVDSNNNKNVLQDSFGGLFVLTKVNSIDP